MTWVKGGDWLKGLTSEQLCGCGCGEFTPIAVNSDFRVGRKRGEPCRFIHGHNTRVKHGSVLKWYGDTPEYEPDADSGCWVWQHGKTDRGYGRKGQVMAHRYVYERERGSIPEGHVLHHTCRNTLCVNPDHLELMLDGDHRRLENARRTDIVRLVNRAGIDLDELEALLRSNGWI